jgi:hypothetical protein
MRTTSAWWASRPAEPWYHRRPLPPSPCYVWVPCNSRTHAQAVQMHVAFSRTVKGAGIIAGVPYWCTWTESSIHSFNIAKPCFLACEPILKRPGRVWCGTSVGALGDMDIALTSCMATPDLIDLSVLWFSSEPSEGPFVTFAFVTDCLGVLSRMCDDHRSKGWHDVRVRRGVHRQPQVHAELACVALLGPKGHYRRHRCAYMPSPRGLVPGFAGAGFDHLLWAHTQAWSKRPRCTTSTTSPTPLAWPW